MKPRAILLVALLTATLHAADTNTLSLVRTIPLSGVRGRIDHFAFDAQGQRLFMAALGNDSVEVIDLKAGQRIRSIGGCSKPQGLAFVPGDNRLVIANGGNGTVHILDASSFKIIKTLSQMPDADNVRYDSKTGFIYVGYGDGALGVIRATNGEIVARIKLSGHPESFQLEKEGSRIFVNVPEAGHIAVVDREQRRVTAAWPMEQFHSNFPMALDEANHRLFIGCRRPARLVVLNMATGKPVGDVEISGDTDDVFYDRDRSRIYAACGAGWIDVLEPQGADTFQLRERIKTVSGARTCFFAAETGQLYLAVPSGLLSSAAEIRVFK